VAELFIMSDNDQKREHPSVLDEAEAIQRQLDEDMLRFEHVCDEDNGYVERLLDRNGIAKDDDLRRYIQEPPLQYTPEQIERLQRDFIQEVFRSLDTEAQAVLRLTAAALPLSNTQESLRKELADARERAARISSTIKEQTGKAPRIRRPRTAGKMLTIAQMAERLNYSRDAVYQMAKDGAIPGCKAFPTSGKKKKSYRADPEIFERWRTAPVRRVKR
jgi:excisionase family DNA binding protein